MIHLNFKKYVPLPPEASAQEGGQALIVLHGLFGSLDNWATLAGRWANDFTIYLVDLRNHGKSPHTQSHTIPDMAGDVKDFIREHKIQNPTVLGHSMGGKVAMELALVYPDMIRALIIADIGPHAYPRGHDDIFRAIRSLDLNKMNCRKDIEEKLGETIHDKGVVFFISKNIDRTKTGYTWKMNIDTIEHDYDEILKAIRAGRIFDKPSLLLRGENSDYVNPENINLLRQFFPRIHVETIPQAGHWLHADNPEEFEEQVRVFMKGL